MDEKRAGYQAVRAAIDSLLEGEDDWVAAMATVACELHHAFAYFDWTGFYRVTAPELLVIGPYQGGHGCLRIPFSKGVCGAAARTKATQLVPDVEAFPGHIACSGTTKSEIVVPVLDARGDVLAVLDVDSDDPAAFDEIDREALEAICHALGARFSKADLMPGASSVRLDAVPALHDGPAMSFTLGDFWALIDLARSRAEVDLSLEPEVIAAILVERSTDERRSFNEHVEALQLRAHHWNTLGPALIIGCGESDEGYLDFRLWLISLGKEGYERTLVEPDWLADLPVDDPRSEWHFGALHSVAGAANAEAGEGELDFYPTEHAPMNGVPCGTDDVSLARRFPRLWERFGTPDADQAGARACVSGG